MRFKFNRYNDVSPKKLSMVYKIFHNGKFLFLLKLLTFHVILAIPNCGYTQTFNVSELDFVSNYNPSFKIDNNNNIHILYMTGNEFDGQLYYRNNIGNKVDEFNEPILIDGFGMLNSYELELYSDGSPYFIYAYQTDEYNDEEGEYVQMFNVKYAEISSNSQVKIDTIFHTNHIISGFKTKPDNAGILHGCFVIDSTHATDMNVYYIYDVLGNNSQYTPLFPTSWYNSGEIHLDSNNLAHIFCDIRNLSKGEYNLVHSVPLNTPVLVDTIVTSSSPNQFKSTKNKNEKLSLIFITDSLYYLDLNADNTYTINSLYSDSKINQYWIQSFAIGDSTLYALSGKFKDTLNFITTNLNNLSNSIAIPFFNNDFQNITVSSEGYIYGLLYNFPLMETAPIYLLESKISLDPLPDLPPAPPVIEDTSLCNMEVLNINVSGVELKWYEDSPSGKLIYKGDSLTINYTNSGLYMYYVTESILNQEGEPYKFEVIVHPLPDISLNSIISLSVEDTLQLNPGEGFQSYLWNDSIAEQTITVIGSEIGIGAYDYTISVSNEFNCYKSDTIRIYVKPVPPIVHDTSVCYKDSVNIVMSEQNIKYYSDPNLNNLVFVGDSITIFNLDTGHNHFFVTQTVGGIESDPSSLNIYVYPLPNISLGSDTTITLEDTLTLDAGLGYNLYLWQDGVDSQYLTIIGKDLGIGTFEYIVNVTDSNLCTNSDTILITVSLINDIYNTNNDGIKVYPNPGKEFIILDLKQLNGAVKELKIYNINGIIQFHNNGVIQELETIDISNLVKGVYLIEIIDADNKSIKSFIKI